MADQKSGFYVGSGHIGLHHLVRPVSAAVEPSGFFAQHSWVIIGTVAVILLALLGAFAARRISRKRRDVRGLVVTLRRGGVQAGRDLKAGDRRAEMFLFVIHDEDSPSPRLGYPAKGSSAGTYQVKRAGRGLIRLTTPIGLRPYEVEVNGPGQDIGNGFELAFRDTRNPNWSASGGKSSGARVKAPATAGTPATADDWSGSGYGNWSDDWSGSGQGSVPTRPVRPIRTAGRSGGTGGDGRERRGDHEERGRFLTGIAPERAPSGARISLLVQVTLAPAASASAALKSFPVTPSGTVVTITVSAPGLIPLGDLEQDLTVPFAADSDPVRFGFRAGPAGLHCLHVRAFAGGTCLGDLALEISVETGAALEEGRPRTAPLPDLAAEPGEVTLQVNRTTAGGYSFQLLSGTLNRAVIIDRLAKDPGEVIGQMIAELRAMSKSTAQYATPALARRRLRSLGSKLWADVVPDSIREQFWAQRDKISLFTIASDMDTVPWELLYPVDLDNDQGFLVEQFPVVRRVYGQDRARVLRLGSGVGFIVPPRSPGDALDEVAAIRGILPPGISDLGPRPVSRRP